MLINNVKIDQNSPTYFIADIAANHDGDISRARDLIYLAAESGANAAKFQHFKADSIVSDLGFKSLGNQSSHQAKWKKSVFEVYKEASVDLSWTKELKETCEKANITFFTTPYDLKIVDFIDDYVPAFKIGSGDLTWHEIIKKVALKNKPYIIATGASSIGEVVEAIDYALKFNDNLCLMQCNTNYTASLENFKYINFNVLKAYRSMYPEILLGLSDHTPGHSTVLGSIALGARMIEKHFTDDHNREGPDHKFSMDPNEWREMVLRSRELEVSLGSSIKRIEDNEKETVILQRRAIRAATDLDPGTKITKENIFPLRPCPQNGIPPYKLNAIEGKFVSKKIKKGDLITFEDLIKG